MDDVKVILKSGGTKPNITQNVISIEHASSAVFVVFSATFVV